MREGAGLRNLGSSADGDRFGAFVADENVSFPYYLTLREKEFVEQVAAERCFAGGDRADAAVMAKLALDGLFRIDLEGAWVSGVEFASRLAILLPRSNEPDHHATLIAGRLLWTTDAQELSRLLYTSGRWAMSFESLATAARLLDQVESLPLPDGWRRLADTSSGWIGWRRQSSSSANAMRRARAKVYVSTSPNYLAKHAGEIFDRLFSVSEAVEAKIASSAQGLHRPDAFVVYGNKFGDIPALARAMSEITQAARPSGMTFSPHYAGSENIFWGIDPLSPEHLVYGESWRRALCARCAHLASRLNRDFGGDPLEGARAALFRCQLDSIDTKAWTPPYADE